jgi:hypothetical protein
LTCRVSGLVELICFDSNVYVIVHSQSHISVTEVVFFNDTTVFFLHRSGDDQMCRSECFCPNVRKGYHVHRCTYCSSSVSIIKSPCCFNATIHCSSPGFSCNSSILLQLPQRLMRFVASDKISNLFLSSPLKAFFIQGLSYHFGFILLDGDNLQSEHGY